MNEQSRDSLPDVERALRSLYDGPVTFDLSAVTEGAARRARRRRRTRAVATAAGATLAVGLVATAAFAASLHPQPSAQPAGGATGASATTTTHPATRTRPAQARVGQPLYGMPDVAPTGSELVGGVTFYSDGGDYGGSAPAMDAQSCQEPGRSGRPEVASRSWSFLAEGSDPAGNQASLTLTGWATGTGADAMAALVTDRGLCTFLHPQTPLVWPGHAAPDHWLAVSGRTGDTRQVVAVTRVGDVLVAVVSSSRSEATAVQMSTRMADTAVDKLRASGLPAAEGKACGAGVSCPPATARPRDAAAPRTMPSENAWAVPDVHPSDPAVVGALATPGQGGLDDMAIPNIPPVMGAQSCQDGRRTGAMPVAGRTWDYGGAHVVEPGGSTGTLTVTGWERGSGPAAMAAVVDNGGFCRFVHPFRAQPWAAHTGADHWLGTWTDAAATQRVTAVAVTRLGDVLVATSVTGPDRRSAVRTATAMTDDAAARLRASGLPAVDGR